MHIKLINKNLYFKNYKVKCSIGKRGISRSKKEGDNKTPKGTYRFTHLFYRKDRISLIKTSLKKIVIKKKMGWCDDTNSSNYNKMIKFPFKYSAERLYIEKKVYDIILVLNYNQNPIKKKRGSAIFMHLATKNYSRTRGCIATSKRDLKLILKNINKKSTIRIY